MFKLLIPVLATLPLLGGVPTEAATAATYDALGIRESHRPIVKVEEACGNGYFRDGNGNCLVWYGDVPAHTPREGCPVDRHFVHWANHRGGFCKLND
jgi:hypothetical protein